MARVRGTSPTAKAQAQEAAAPVPPGLMGVARTREARLRKPYDHSMMREMDDALREIKKQKRAVGGGAKAWLEVVPEELASRSRLLGVSRGTLEVVVPDAATRFALDRFLRAGGERSIVAVPTSGIQRVRVTIGG